MRKSIYTATGPGIVDTEYDDQLKSVIVTWYNFHAPKDMRSSCEAQLKTIQTNKGKCVIVDTLKAKNSVPEADQKWFIDHLFPEYIKAGLMALITVKPESAIANISTTKYQIQGQKAGLVIHDCKDIESAIRYAKEIQKTG